MSYPSLFISKQNLKDNCIEDGFISHDLNNMHVTYREEMCSDVVVIKDEDYFLIAHVNEMQKKKIQGDLKSGVHELLSQIKNDYETFIETFHWGFLFIVEFATNENTLINDPFGIYPIYVTEDKAKLIISNDFYRLCSFHEKIHFDAKGIADYFLFNYTLQSRTLIKEISEMRGGRRLSFSNNSFNQSNVFETSSLLKGKEEEENIPMDIAFQETLLENIKTAIPTELALTGGFDNKVSLSVLLNSQRPFKSFTFGDNHHPDQIAASEVAKLFNIKHHQLNAGEDFLKQLELYKSKFIRNAGNAPILDSLIYYQLVNKEIEPSNLVLGQMGGELIVGPVLISELVTTKSSALLLNALNETELALFLKENLAEIKMLNHKSLESHFEKYVSELTEYTDFERKKNNEHLVRFLIQETYSKFFGTVFSNLFGKYNVINPYLNVPFLKSLYASKYSFLKKQTFKKSPTGHFFSRRLYPTLIQKIYPEVLQAKMDRGYRLSDFLKWYNFYKPVLNYAKRHLVKKKKTKSLTHEINHLLVGQFKLNWNDSKLRNYDFINEKEIDHLLNVFESKDISKSEEKNLLKLIALDHLLESHEINIVGLK